MNPTFWKLVLAEDVGDKSVVDVGTGSGRVALALAPLARRVVGIDREAEVIAEARRRAADAGLDNVTFVVGDVERAPAVDFAHLAPAHSRPDLVVSHLYLSDQLVAGAARALAPGGALVAMGFHTDQWKETGRTSRFAYSEDTMTARLDENGFAVESMTVDRQVQQFRSVEEALAAAIGLEERWRTDGRWFGYIEFLERGGRTLTQAHLVVKARRR